MGTLLVNGVKASRVPPERTFGLPKGWAVHSTPAPAYELRYEGKRRRPPPLWELADVEQLVFFDHATREFAATPRPPPPRAVDDETGSEPHNATWPRIHFGVCALPRLGPRYEHVRSVLSQHTCRRRHRSRR